MVRVKEFLVSVEVYYQYFSRVLDLLSANRPYGVPLVAILFGNASYGILKQLNLDGYKVSPNTQVATNKTQTVHTTEEKDDDPG